MYAAHSRARSSTLRLFLIRALLRGSGGATVSKRACAFSGVAYQMMIIRISKTAAVAATALFSTLVAFGNLTDYGTNFAFVQHVMSMDTIFPDAAIKYRAITNPALHNLFYLLIIAAEALTAILCWIGAYRLATNLRNDARSFNASKTLSIAGLTLGFLVWQVGFMSVGGEWFGMWMSKTWNGVPDAFRFFITILLVLVFVAQRDEELA